jgi:integrase
MDRKTTTTSVEATAARELRRRLEEIGPSECVARYIRSYAKVRVQSLYALHLLLYFRWLRKSREVPMTPDELIVDNLRCIYRSEPEDVATKRKHRVLLEDYLNQELIRCSESHRRVAAAAVKGLYEKNDSPLFGKVNIAVQEAVSPDRALKTDDIRRVLRALPIGIRIPLLCTWQSGCEINRVLALRWKDLEGLQRGDHPLQLTFHGRKRHRRSYFTFLGRDAVQHLKLWSERWRENVGRPPQPDDLVFLGKRQRPMGPGYINRQFREMALKLARQGMIENVSPGSWHSHMLRHSFKTEGEHAGLRSGMIEFMMGHSGGIAQVYDNRDEVHTGDFVEAYKKAEPHLSLDYTETTLREEYEGTNKQMLQIITELQKKVARLEAQSGS